MTEASAPAPATAPEPAPSPTGIVAVDAVLDLVAGLGERPLEEHAGVLEEAHAELRRVLDDPPPVD